MLPVEALRLALAQLPTATLPAPTLAAGETVEARVAAVLANGTTRLAIGEGAVDVRLPVALPVGTTVRLEVESVEPQPALRLVEIVPPPAAAPVDAADLAAHTALETIARLAPPAGQPRAGALPGEAAIIARAALAAATRQNGLAPLFAELEPVLAAPEGALPEPLRAAARALLALRADADAGLDTAALKAAIAGSGLFREARGAVAAPEPAAELPLPEDGAAPRPNAAAPPGARPPAGEAAAGDLKSALLALRAEAAKVLIATPQPAAREVATPEEAIRLAAAIRAALSGESALSAFAAPGAGPRLAAGTPAGTPGAGPASAEPASAEPAPALALPGAEAAPEELEAALLRLPRLAATPAPLPAASTAGTPDARPLPAPGAAAAGPAAPATPTAPAAPRLTGAPAPDIDELPLAAFMRAPEAGPAPAGAAPRLPALPGGPQPGGPAPAPVDDAPKLALLAAAELGERLAPSAAERALQNLQNLPRPGQQLTAAEAAALPLPLPRLALPRRGAPPLAQRLAPPLLTPVAGPRAMAERLFEAADAALARETLLQIASLPKAASPHAAAEAAARGEGEGDAAAGAEGGALRPEAGRPQEAARHWAMEVPLVFRGETQILALTVDDEREAARRGETEGWSLRFSLDLRELGPVHGRVTLGRKGTAVTLWAEQPGTLEALRRDIGDLERSLAEAAVELDALDVVAGRPASGAISGTGYLLDRRS